MKKLVWLLLFKSLTGLADVSGGGISDYFGNPITSRSSGAQWPLDVGITVSGTVVDPRSRTWTLLNTTDSVNVGNFPATQAVTQSTSPWVTSGTVSSTQGTSPWVDNITQFGGNNVVTGTGASGVGIPRVTVSNDSNILATQSGAWTTGRTWTLLNTTDSVNSVQSGAWTTGRTWTLSSGTDSIAAAQSGTWTVQQGSAPWSVSQSGTWNVGLNAGSNLVGKVGIDQTTPGTTNGVQVNAALPTGTNSIGQVTANAGTNLNTSLLALQSGANMMLDRSGTGNITAQCTTPASCPANSTVTATTNGAATTIFNITNTFVGTVVFEGNDGNGNWLSAIGGVPGNGSPTASTGTPLALAIPSGGFSQVRARCSVFVSGTITASYNVGAGLNMLQVFNLTPSGLQATVTGSGSAGTPATGVISVQGISGGTNLPVSQATAANLQATARVNDGAGISIGSGYGTVANGLRVAAQIGNASAVADFNSGATGAQTLRAAANTYDGAGNSITSTLETGTAANKQALDVTSISTGTTRYFTAFTIQQTAGTAANASVFSMRNAAASTKTAILENVYCRMGFNATNPITRTQQSYIFQRFSAATPTGGTALTAGLGDSSDGASQVTDIRFLDTGLTTTGVTFVANNLGTMACDTTQGATCQEPILSLPSAWRFAPGEGLVIRLGVVAVTGTSISCNINWREQ